MSDSEAVEYDALKFLAAGCRTHKAYRGVRKPRLGCQVCQDIYNIVQDFIRKGEMQGEMRLRKPTPAQTEEMGANA